VAAGQEDDRRRCSTVTPVADATAVLRRHIAVAQLDTRMRVLSGATMAHGDSNQWHGDSPSALGAQGSGDGGSGMENEEEPCMG
jgi:hypothetical protein